MIELLRKTRVRLLVATFGAASIAGCANFDFERDGTTPVEPILINPADTLPSFNKNDQSPGFFRMALGKYTVTVCVRRTHLEGLLTSRDSVRDEHHAHHGEQGSRHPSPQKAFLQH